ncbi:MAG: hypothetical protein H6581_27285 [Bacteroidia bacterium]|nr:hypothetical protein [Bacteroidia bacterium]
MELKKQFFLALLVSLLGSLICPPKVGAQAMPKQISTYKAQTAVVDSKGGMSVVQMVPENSKLDVLSREFGLYQGCADYWYQVQLPPDTLGRRMKGWLHGSETNEMGESSKINISFRKTWTDFFHFLQLGAVRQADDYLDPNDGLYYLQLDKDLNPEALKLQSIGQVTAHNYTGIEVVHNHIFATVVMRLSQQHQFVRYDNIDNNTLCCYPKQGSITDLSFVSFNGLSYVAADKIMRKYGETDLVNPGDEIYHSAEYADYCKALELESRVTRRHLISSQGENGCSWLVSTFWYQKGEKWYLLAADSHQCIRVDK